MVIDVLVQIQLLRETAIKKEKKLMAVPIRRGGGGKGPNKKLFIQLLKERKISSKGGGLKASMRRPLKKYFFCGFPNPSVNSVVFVVVVESFTILAEISRFILLNFE